MFMEHKLERTVKLWLHTGNPVFQLRNLLRPKRSTHTARNNGIASEPVATDKRGHVEIFTADAPAERSCLKERDIAGECAEITCMVGNAFKLQKKCANAQSFTVRGRKASRKRTAKVCMED